MENLSVKNFLTIREADFEVKRFNIVIGSQANGKSVLAKLLFFFREFLGAQILQSLENGERKTQVTKNALEKFEQYFPRYSWNDQEFSIVYNHDSVSVWIENKPSRTVSQAATFNYSENVALAYRKAKTAYSNRVEETEENISTEVRRRSSRSVFLEVINEYFYESSIGRSLLLESVFIPASRSFFSVLQRNVFSFLANNLIIDPFIKEFGSRYEVAKTAFRSVDDSVRRSGQRPIPQRYKAYMSNIMLSDYVFENGEDILILQNNTKRINLAHASSGQQEALPMLIVLLAQTRLQSRNPNRMFFIEEPEAHLFPTSQKRTVELFAEIYNTQSSSFFITTHSPYILTALNNFITASKVALAFDDPKTYEQVSELVPPTQWINYGDVSAYTVEKGVLKNICDDEINLIGASIIDSVSDEFDLVYDNLLEIRHSQTEEDDEF